MEFCSVLCYNLVIWYLAVGDIFPLFPGNSEVPGETNKALFKTKKKKVIKNFPSVLESAKYSI